MERPFTISQLWAATKESAVVIYSENLEYALIVTYLAQLKFQIHNCRF